MVVLRTVVHISFYFGCEMIQKLILIDIFVVFYSMKSNSGLPVTRYSLPLVSRFTPQTAEEGAV